MADLELNHDVDNSTDESPQNEEHPYHSLSSSNLTLRRYGTVSSLERLGTEEIDDQFEETVNSSSESEDEEVEKEGGIDNEAFNHTSLRNWTVKAGSFVFEKMAFFERLEGCGIRTRVSERSKLTLNYSNFADALYLSDI